MQKDNEAENRIGEGESHEKIKTVQETAQEEEMKGRVWGHKPDMSPSLPMSPWPFRLHSRKEPLYFSLAQALCVLGT